MWTPVIEKMESKNERERLEQAEDNIRSLKEVIAYLEKRIENLEKKENDN